MVELRRLIYVIDSYQISQYPHTQHTHKLAYPMLLDFYLLLRLLRNWFLRPLKAIFTNWSLHKVVGYFYKTLLWKSFKSIFYDFWQCNDQRNKSASTASRIMVCLTMINLHFKGKSRWLIYTWNTTKCLILFAGMTITYTAWFIICKWTS